MPRTAVLDDTDVASAPVTRKVIGWKGQMMPFGARSSDSRVIERPPGGVRVRGLPVGMKWQKVATAGHDQALTGLATLTKTWSSEDALWGSGPIDMDDPEGRLLAHKIEKGFVGLMSVDLADWTSTFQTTEGGSRVEVLTDYELISATFLNDSAYGQARVFPVYEGEELVQNSTVMKERRVEAGLFHADKVLTFNGTGTRVTLVTEEPASLRVTGSTDLPWAPRDRPWDAQSASDRVWAWADGDTSKLASAHLWTKDDGNPRSKSSYSLPFADVIDGRLTAVFSALSSAAGRLDQTDIPVSDRAKVASRIRQLYASANRSIGGDEPIEVPPGVKNMTNESSVDEPAPSDTPVVAGIDYQALADAIVDRLGTRFPEVFASKKNTPVDDDPEDVDDVTDTDEDDDSDEEERLRKERVARAKSRMSQARAAAACSRMLTKRSAVNGLF